MRPALVTLVPMLAAAILVMVGGERMARKHVEHRTPSDRERLLDLGDTFREELSRLDSLYLRHMERLASRALHAKPAEATDDAAEIAGVRLIRVFREHGKDLTLSPSRDDRRLPEIELEKRKRPLDPSTAVIIERSRLDNPIPAEAAWMPTTDPHLRLHCRQPQPGVLVVFLIDLEVVSERISGHLGTWLPGPLTPLREAGERVQVEPPAGQALATIGPERHGPAASVIPIRTLFGHWQIRAWDGLVVSRTHDQVTFTRHPAHQSLAQPRSRHRDARLPPR